MRPLATYHNQEWGNHVGNLEKPDPVCTQSVNKRRESMSIMMWVQWLLPFFPSFANISQIWKNSKRLMTIFKQMFCSFVREDFFSCMRTSKCLLTTILMRFALTHVLFAGWLAYTAWLWTRNPSCHIVWPPGGRTSRWKCRGRGGNLQSKISREIPLMCTGVC